MYCFKVAHRQPCPCAATAGFPAASEGAKDEWVAQFL
jgi:hypothetical protein